MKRPLNRSGIRKRASEPNLFDDNPWNQFFQFGKRLDELRIFVEHGVVRALYDALTLLRVERHHDHADWVLQACQEIIKDRIERGIAIGKNRTRNEDKRFQQALIDFSRWRAVEKARTTGLRGGEADKKALEMLKGTPAGYASEDAVKKSYQKVKRDFRNPHRPYLYYQALIDWPSHHKATVVGTKKPKNIP